MIEVDDITYARGLAGKFLDWGNVDVASGRKSVLSVVDELHPKFKILNKPSNRPPVQPLQGRDVNSELSLHLQMTISQAGVALGDGGIALVVVGEDHDCSADKARAEELLRVHSEYAGKVTMIVFERKIGYKQPRTYNGPLVIEDHLTTAWGMSIGKSMPIRVRSIIIAGYIFLCVAVGDQRTKEKILVFFGAEHKDILEHFEYFVQNSTAAWVKLRPRSYTFIASNV